MKEYLNKFCCLLSGLSIFLSGCSGEEISQEKPEENLKNNVLLIKRPSLHTENLIDFYINVVRTSYLNKDQKGGNIIVSPYGIVNLLAMTAHAVPKNLGNDIAKSMGMNDLDEIDAIIKYFRSSESDWYKAGEIRLRNSCWLRQPTPNEGYETLMREIFGADICYFFDNPVTEPELFRESIKAWCKAHSNGLISEMNLSSIDYPDSFIMNGLLFDGKLNSEDYLEDNVFYGVTNDTSVKMFRPSTLNSSGFLTKEFRSVLLPLNNNFVMQIILPNSGYDLDCVMKSLNRESLLSQKPNENYACIQLPVCNLSSVIEYNGEIFSNLMDFSSDKLSKIEESLGHKVQMYNIGTVKLNSGEIKASSINTSPSMNYAATKATSQAGEYFIVDQPFVFFLWDFASGACLLAGSIKDL